MKKNNLTRRDFLAAASATAAFSIVPSFVLGANGQTPPSDKLNIAAIGCGGMGGVNINMLSGQNFVALCDVDDDRAMGTFEKYPDVPKFKDFRKMLEKHDKDIDAVLIATPDHTHAVAAMAAMKMGKHVYVQKPMTHDIYEARELTKAARKYKVMTQMGNQGHANEEIRLIREWVQDGAIGNVTRVHAWTNRPGGPWGWPQGVDVPKNSESVPGYLDWDLWLGTAANRPYSSAYCPGLWRGWWDFGTGALGDMGCHIIDPIFWALDLGAPDSVEASCVQLKEQSAPLASMVTYKFGARGKMPAVELIWYDGGLKPPRPEELEPGRKMGSDDGGAIFEGDKGKLMFSGTASAPRLIPETAMQAYKRPEKTIPRVIGSHEDDWVRACKTGKPASSNFDYAGPLTETVLLGNLAIRAGEKIYWDSENLKVTNCPAANELVQRQYRQGWSL